MTERSRFWGGTTIGDATVAPYDAETEFAQVLMSVAGANEVPTHRSLVFRDELNELAVTGGASPVAVATGRAIVYGTWYENDALVSVTIPTPGAATRIDRIVVRKDWVAQTTRITRIAGTEGAGVPAMTQVAGTTWDMPLFQVSITTGGVITLTDERNIFPRSHGVKAYHSVDVIVANNTTVQPALNSELFDTDGYHSLTVNNSRLTVPAGLGGKYSIIAQATFEGNATGTRILWITLNGVTIIARHLGLASAAIAAHMETTTIYELAAGDYVEMNVFQDSGAGRTLFGFASAPNHSPVLSMYRLGA